MSRGTGRSAGSLSLRGLMRRGAALLAALACAASAVAAPEPTMSAALARERDLSLRTLCALYGLPPQECARPLEIAVVNRASEIPEGYPPMPPIAAGAAWPDLGRAVVVRERTGSYPFGDDLQVLRHEISHLLLQRALGYEAPRWLEEGLAMRAAGEWGASDEWYAALALPGVASGRWSLTRVEADFAQGEGQVRRSYALTRSFVTALLPTDRDVTQFVASARAHGSVDAAFLARFGLSPERAFQEWARRLPWWGPLAALLTSAPSLWTGVTLLFLAAAWATARRRRAWRLRWAEEEREAAAGEEPPQVH